MRLDTHANEQAVIADGEFARLMARFAPFETAPHVAVGVSGGADSMALAMLADRWARARGGRITALSVDHGLRPDSALEAEHAGRRLARLGIAQVVLRWEGAKPATGIQEAARAERYRLLEDWCRAHGVLHLALAHHRADQAETHAMRHARGSGERGLSGMAAVVERAGLRWLRPLLTVDPERLRASLGEAGLAWSEDPSNRDPRFARARLRGEGMLDIEASADAARLAGRRRAERERHLADDLAACVAVDPSGWASLERRRWRALGAAPRRAVIERVLACIGARPYAPRGERLDRLLGALESGAAHRATLAGCVIAAAAERVIVTREPAACAPAIAVTGPGRYVWDDRFRLDIGGEGWRGALTLARLGEAGYAAIARDLPPQARARVPAPARAALPALWDLEGVVAVPHLNHGRRAGAPDTLDVLVWFQPRHALLNTVFAAC